MLDSRGSESGWLARLLAARYVAVSTQEFVSHAKLNGAFAITLMSHAMIHVAVALGQLLCLPLPLVMFQPSVLDLPKPRRTPQSLP